MVDLWKRPWLWITVALALRVAAAMSNVGFVALDDYSDMLSSTIPISSTAPMSLLIEQSGIRSPIPRLTLRVMAAPTAWIGLNEPVNQVRWLYFWMGLYSLLSVWAAWKIFMILEQKRSALWALILTSTFFLLPFISTRVMIETFSTPLLSLSALSLCLYHAHHRRRDLVWAIAWLAMASIFRFQVGVCIAAIPVLIWLKKRHQDWLPFAIASLAAFVLTGLVDWALRGSFHFSLLEYVRYNLKEGSSYGTSPVYTYVAFLMAFALPPTFLSRYRGMKWHAEFYHLLPVNLFLLFFVLGHSLIPHKEVRFLTPIIPLFLVALVPLMRFFWEQGQRWRVYFFMPVNLCLLGLTTFPCSQNNVVGLALYTQQHLEIHEILNVDDSVVIFPYAYTLNRPQVIPVDAHALLLHPLNCNQIVAVREDRLASVANLRPSWKEIAIYAPGPLENILIRLNPGKNIRRAAIHVYGASQCSL